MLRVCSLLILALICGSTAPAAVVDFEDLTVFTGTSGNTDGQPGGRFYNGDSGIGTNSNGWSSGGVLFNNDFDVSFGGVWTGWAYSNVVNPVTASFNNQYASAAGGGANGSGGTAAGGNYAIAFLGGSYFNLPTGMQIASVEVTNTTYSRFSMLNGDAFAKQFGGPSGNDPDFFRAKFTAYDAISAGGNQIGSVTIDLADFTFADNSQDFILNDWTQVDLSSLVGARSIGLEFESTDVGQFGINTPTYIAIDNLRLSAVPEPSCLILLGVVGMVSALRRRSRALSR